MRQTKVRRNQDLRHGCLADPRVGHFIADQFVQFFADICCNTLGAMRVH